MGKKFSDLSLLHWTAAAESDHLREVGGERGRKWNRKSILPKEEEWKVNFYFLSPPLFSLGLFWRRMGKKSFFTAECWLRGVAVVEGSFIKPSQEKQLRICCPSSSSSVSSSSFRRQTTNLEEKRGEEKPRAAIPVV